MPIRLLRRSSGDSVFNRSGEKKRLFGERITTEIVIIGGFNPGFRSPRLGARQGVLIFRCDGAIRRRYCDNDNPAAVTVVVNIVMPDLQLRPLNGDGDWTSAPSSRNAVSYSPPMISRFATVYHSPRQLFAEVNLSLPWDRERGRDFDRTTQGRRSRGV